MAKYQNIQDRPKPLFWFRVYAGFMAAIYIFVMIIGIGFLIFDFGIDEPAISILMAIIYIALGLLFGGAYLLTYFLKPSPFSWVYDLVLICIGFGGCPTIIAAIPLLIYYIKPEMKQYYGKE